MNRLNRKIQFDIQSNISVCDVSVLFKVSDPPLHPSDHLYDIPHFRLSSPHVLYLDVLARGSWLKVVTNVHTMGLKKVTKSLFTRRDEDGLVFVGHHAISVGRAPQTSLWPQTVS